jgi:hypothetical protein
MTVEAEDDINADIRAAIEGGSTEEAPAIEAPVEAPVEAPAATEAPGDNRERGPDGKFVAKPAEVAQPVAVQPPLGSEPPKEAIRPPVSWSATAKADFARLPAHIQQEVLKREKDIEAGMAQWNPKGERLNKFEALIAPRRDKLALAGVDEFTAIGQLLAAQDFLERDPNGALAYLAQQYGATLPEGFQQPGSQIQYADPQVQALQSRLDQIERARQDEINQRETEAQGAARFEWETFRTSPENPYAENVRQEMHALLAAGQVTNLKDAYDRAVWANPETRALLQSQVAAPVAPKDTRPAGLSIAGAPGLGGAPAGTVDMNASVEDDIRRSIEQIRGRA